MGINSVTWQELNDPHNEWGTLDLDKPHDDPDWWRQQDADLEREELERLEIMAEMEELRHNGYGE